MLEDSDASVSALGGGQSASVFQEVSSTKPLYRRVAEEVIGAIEAGHYPVGSMLPKERDLADAFGVSRSSIREALSCLQFEGYVETRHGSGTVVISAVDRASYSSLQMGDLSQYGPIDIMETRLLVEPEVVAIAASQPLRKELRDLKRVLAGMERDVDGSEHGRSDLAVHSALLKVCPNRLLGTTAETLLNASGGDAFRIAREKAWEEPALPKEWLIHHQEIVRAVIERDAAGAKSAYIRHLVSVLTQLLDVGVLAPEEVAKGWALAKRYQEKLFAV